MKEREMSNDGDSEKADLKTLICYSFAKETMPKNLKELLKEYDFMKCATPTNLDISLDKILMPDEEAVDHVAQYVHTGCFEWYDETLGRSVACNRTCNFKVALNKDSYTYDFSLWPRKLKVNFIPKNAISPLHPLLGNAKRLFFHFHPKDTTDTVPLLKRLGKGFVGDIRIPLRSECEVKRFFCVFVPERQLMMGVIPEKQPAFVRQVEFILRTLREERVSSVITLIVFVVCLFYSKLVVFTQKVALRVRWRPGGLMSEVGGPAWPPMIDHFINHMYTSWPAENFWAF